MDKNSIVNLFEHALKHSELLEFAIGKGNYFIPDREYGGHWIYAAWKNHILVFLKNKVQDEENNVIDMFLRLINSDLPIIEKGKYLLYHINTYYYFLKEKKIENNFLINIEENISSTIKEYANNIKTDKGEKAYDNILESINLINSRGANIDLEIKN